MDQKPLKEDIFSILRLLSTNDNLTQRDLSAHLGMSLGKTNYLLRQLLKIGFLEVRNFVSRENKINKFRYHLTKEGWQERIRLTHHFLKRKESEYDLMKKDWQELSNKKIANKTEQYSYK